MKLSTRATYAVRAMMALAESYGEGTVMLKEVAERQHLPATYLEQLMVPLRKAKLVSATRGAHGGYMLARPPADITAADVIQALEGSLEIVECSAVPCCDTPEEVCALRELWSDASRALEAVFQRATLASLVERQREKDASRTLTYSI